MAVLSKKLNETGWTDDTHDKSKGAPAASSVVANRSSYLPPLRNDAKCRSTAICSRTRGRASLRLRQWVISFVAIRANAHDEWCFFAASISPAVKQEVMALIRHYLDTQLEK